MMYIDLYSGLLGVGKTTLIRRMLETAYKDQQVVILENEIGKVNYDSAVLESSKIEVQRLTAGCVCCTIAAGLQSSIRMIQEQLHPDVIIIEPSGAADVKSLLTLISAIPDVRIGRSVMIIHAKKCHALLQVVGIFFHDQIKCADVIFLNFVEKLKEGQLESVEAELLEINPKVKFVAVPMSEVTGDEFPVRREEEEEEAADSVSMDSAEAEEAPAVGEEPVEVEEAPGVGAEPEQNLRVFGADRDRSLQVKEIPDDAERGSGSAGTMKMGAGRGSNPGMMNGLAGHSGFNSGRAVGMGAHRGSRADGSDTIYTWEYNFDKPFTKEMIRRLTDIFQSEEAARIWRVKGVLTMEDGSLRKYDISYGDAFEEAWTSETEVPTNTLVIIGTSIPKKWLEHHFSEL